MNPNRARLLNAALSTPRLTLEPQTARHADEYFELLQNDDIYQWISLKAPISVDALRARWGRLESRVSPDQSTAWLNWVVRRSADGQCLGSIDAEVTDADEATNVGYVFVPAFWGKGYATESVRAVVEHLSAMGVGRMVATVTVGNTASSKVLEKAGFVRTRVLRAHDTIRGVLCDDIEYIWDRATTSPSGPHSIG